MVEINRPASIIVSTVHGAVWVIYNARNVIAAYAVAEGVPWAAVGAERARAFDILGAYLLVRVASEPK